MYPHFASYTAKIFRFFLQGSVFWPWNYVFSYSKIICELINQKSQWCHNYDSSKSGCSILWDNKWRQSFSSFILFSQASLDGEFFLHLAGSFFFFYYLHYFFTIMIASVWLPHWPDRFRLISCSWAIQLFSSTSDWDYRAQQEPKRLMVAVCLFV